MDKTSIKDMKIPLDKAFYIDILSVKKDEYDTLVMLIKTESYGEYLISVPGNYTWNHIDIESGGKHVVRIIAYGKKNELRKMEHLRVA